MSGLRPRALPSWQVTLGLALAALGFLVAVQLRSEAPRVRYTSQERTPLLETVRSLQAQQELLRSAVLAGKTQMAELEASGNGNAALVADLNRRLATARLAAGLVAVKGPGIVIRLEDSTLSPTLDQNAADYTVSAADIRTLVTELWLAGAEAVAVNGERIVARTAIVDLGPSILVNSAYLAPPYDIGAIGPTDMYDRLRRSVTFAEFYRIRVQGYGLQVRVAERESPVIAAYAGSAVLRFGTVVPASGASPAPNTSPPGSPAGASPTP